MGVHDEKNSALRINDLENSTGRRLGHFVALEWAWDKASREPKHEGNQTVEFWADIALYFSKNLRTRCSKNENLAQVCSLR